MADLLDGVRARTAAFCRTVLEPPWALRIADGAPLALATAMRGHAFIVPDDGPPTLLRTGDVAVIKGPDHYTVGDDPSTRPTVVVQADNRVVTPDGVDVTDRLRRAAPADPADGSAVVASGTYQVGGDVPGRLLDALPRVVRVPCDDARSPIMDLLAAEVARDDPGQRVVLDRLLDLALIATLRAWFARPGADPPGWYLAHGDPLVGGALRLIHEDPSRPWTVGSLASAAGASRAAFARRFAALVGQPPMTYVARLRLDRAADLLRDTDATVESVAHAVGYANAFALTVAFKRVRGHTPREHRGARRAARTAEQALPVCPRVAGAIGARGGYP